MMVQIPNGLKYTEDHVWVKVKDDKITLGVTEHLLEMKEDVLDVGLPETDVEVEEGSRFATVEFSSGVHHLIAPVSGFITEVNGDLESSPETINEDPYGDGWIVTIEPQDVATVASLLDDFEYEDFLDSED